MELQHNNGLGVDQLDLIHNEPLIDFKALFGRVLRYWYLFVLSIGIAYFAYKFYVRYSIRVYEVKMTLLIKDEKSSGGLTSEALLEDLGIGKPVDNIGNELQILRSRTLMEKVIRNLNLNISLITIGRINSLERYADSPIVLDSFQLNENALGKTFIIKLQDDENLLLGLKEDELTLYKFNTPIETAYGTLYISSAGNRKYEPGQMAQLRIRHPEDVAQSYANRLRISAVGDRTSVFELRLTDQVPQKAVDILNELVRVYNEVTIDEKNQVAKNTMEFISERVELLTGELSIVESELENYKRNNAISAEIMENVGGLLSEYRGLENELATFEIQGSLIQSLELFLADPSNQFSILPPNLGVNTELLGSQIEAHNALILERMRLLRSSGTNNPAILEVEQQIRVIRNTILLSLKNAKEGLVLNRQVVVDKSDDLQQRILSIPSKERGFLDIQRQQSIKQQLYLYLLQKREETALSQAITPPNSRTIDVPRINNSPISPKTRNIFAFAMVLGMAIPSLFILLLEFLDDTIKSEKDIKQHTKAPILGKITHKKTDDEIVVTANSRTAIAEMFRSLRTNLQFMDAGASQKTILVTSSVSGEGKTFITVNLGMSMAISGKKTIILGLDLRKPKLGKYLGTEDTQVGVSSYLIGEASESEIIQTSNSHPNLSFITSGPIPPNPAELLLNDRLVDLFSYLNSNYDIILLDTSPVSLVADAFLLNDFIDYSLYVIRFGLTRKPMVKRLAEFIQQQNIKKPAIVFNGIKARAGYGYYSKGYGYYGGKYGYGYYEQEKEKKKSWFSLQRK